MARRPKKKKVTQHAVLSVPPPKPKPAARKRAKFPYSTQSAAVVLTLLPGAVERGVTYKEILAMAKGGVNLSELSINDLSVRDTATGAKIVQIPGPDGAEQADKMAERIRPALEGIASVVRPTKKVDIRVADLDESIEREEVVLAAAEKGGCDISQIRAGDLHPYGRGTFSMHLSLPVTAAKALVEARRL